MAKRRKPTPKRQTGGRFRNPSICHPLADTLLVGGLSIAVIAILLAIGYVFPEAYQAFRAAEPVGENGEIATRMSDRLRLETLSWVVILSVLINGPHFMASYWVLYSFPEHKRRYPWSTTHMPRLLAGMAVASAVLIWVSGSNGQPELFDRHFADFAQGEGGVMQLLRTFWAATMAAPEFVLGRVIFMALHAVSIFYLAWHYNGQGWGMTASYCYLAGLRLDEVERKMIRTGYRAMTAVHVGWVLYFAASEFGVLIAPVAAQNVMNFIVALTMLSYAFTLPLGLAGFRRASKRTGQPVPLRAVVPWLAVYSWYLLIYIHPYFFLVLQISHAAQYLAFPLRVEVNRDARQNERSRGQSAVRLSVIYLALTVMGYLLLELPDQLGLHPVEIAGLGASVINIHHFFADGVIWKISNPEVREQLFSHLEPVEAGEA